jgi:RNA-directed DNA polymerase
MLALRDAICQSANLGNAFGRYRRYRGLWAPGVPMSVVAKAPVLPMLELAEELRYGRYRPSAPHEFSVAKANGEVRVLKVFSIRDRVAQRALLQVLQARPDPGMSPCSFGYRPGRGVMQALARVRALLDQGLSWVVDADIEHCFDTIPRKPLLEEVTRRVGTPEAAGLVARWMGWEGAGQRDQTGIPQGAVLSPWLCNVYLWRLDDAMQAERVPMVRFADDFVLLTAGRHHAETLRRCCAQVVRRMRLRLHPLKTAVVDASHSFRFLGQRLAPTRLLTFASAGDSGDT